MLIVARSMKELSVPGLMEVYEEDSRKTGAARYPWESPSRQQVLAEEDFREYLFQVFFREKDAVYLIWEDAGRYVSALRLEPYQDGFLLEGLETATGQRRKGYASRLLREAQAYLTELGPVRLYSHVAKGNTPSLRTHFACGFHRHLDYARYIDGSVDSRSVTLLYTSADSQKNEEIP